jgi:hypothetical protein
MARLAGRTDASCCWSTTPTFLDQTSAALVHQLASSGATTVLATVRAGEPAPDAVVALLNRLVKERAQPRSTV